MSPLPKKPTRAQDTLGYHKFASQFPPLGNAEFKALEANPDAVVDGDTARAISLLYAGEIAVLREFARFVINRVTAVRTDPKDHAEYKDLLAKVKATLKATLEGES